MKKVGEFSLAKGDEAKTEVAEYLRKTADEEFSEAWNAPLPEAPAKFAKLGVRVFLCFSRLRGQC